MVPLSKGFVSKTPAGPFQKTLLDFSSSFRADVQIRYRHHGVPAKVTPLKGLRAKIDFDDPQISIAPGQSAVFYQDDCVVGGGWLE